VKEGAETKINELKGVVEKNQDTISKYIKGMFEKINDKQFTVGTLVGEGPKY
jgi:predicted ester cyclase